MRRPKGFRLKLLIKLRSLYFVKCLYIQCCHFKIKCIFASALNVLNVETGYFGMDIITVSIHCAPEMSEIDCIGRIESFWPKFVRGW